MEPTTVYTMMHTSPEVVKILLEKMLDAFFKITDYMDKRFGIKNRQSIGGKCIYIGNPKSKNFCSLTN